MTRNPNNELSQFLELHALDSSGEPRLADVIKQERELSEISTIVRSVIGDQESERRRLEQVVRAVVEQMRNSALWSVQLVTPLANLEPDQTISGTLAGRHNGQLFRSPITIHLVGKYQYQIKANFPLDVTPFSLLLGNFAFGEDRAPIMEWDQLPATVEQKQKWNHSAAVELFDAAADGGGQRESQPRAFNWHRDPTGKVVVSGKLPTGKESDFVVLVMTYVDNDDQPKKLNLHLQLIAKKAGAQYGEARFDLKLPLDAGNSKVKLEVRPLCDTDVESLAAGRVTQFVETYAQADLTLTPIGGGHSFQVQHSDERAAFQATETRCFMRVAAKEEGKVPSASAVDDADAIEQQDHEPSDLEFLRDRESLLRAKPPCAKAQAEVVRRFLSKLKWFSQRRLGLDEHEAEDVAITGLTDYLMEKPGDGKNPRAYLYTIVKHAGTKLIRRNYFTDEMPIRSISPGNPAIITVSDHRVNGQPSVKIFDTACNPTINGLFQSHHWRSAKRNAIGKFEVIDRDTIRLHTRVNEAAKGGSLHVRRRKPVQQMPRVAHDNDAGAREPPSPPPCLSSIELSELEGVAQTWLKGLNSSQRDVVFLRIWHELKFLEIDQELGLGNDTARKRYAAAMSKLKRKGSVV